MPYMQYLFYLILLPSVITDPELKPELNLYYTDWVNSRGSGNDNTLQHNCLRYNVISSAAWESVPYCMSELPSTFKIENYDYLSKFTFDELAEQDITSEKLILWSAPIDLIEHYQSYLNQLSITNDLSLAKQVFYNCTPLRFGPMCQYQLGYHRPDHSSGLEIIDDYDLNFIHDTTNWICYMHLQCTQHLYSPCLDWADVCDGKIDCLNGGIDEEHCWELEINQCNDNEYRCKNGQCIPYSFFGDQYINFDCIDGSDHPPDFVMPDEAMCSPVDLPFACDGTTKCMNTIHLTSSCSPSRKNLLRHRMFSIKNDSVFEHCWSALKCLFNIQDVAYPFCDNLCADDGCKNIILKMCPDMLYFPNMPVFFDDVYLAFKKNDSPDSTSENIGLLYVCSNNSGYDAFFNMSSKISFDNSACFLQEKISYPQRWFSLWDIAQYTSLRQLNDDLKKYQLIFNYTSIMCNRSNMYQCINSSKCISIHRLMDNFYDCPYMDDETMLAINKTHSIEQLKQTHYKCQVSDKYIHILMIRNDYCDCGYIEFRGCEDENYDFFELGSDISFQTTCDGYVELLPITINGRNETDETECEQWECNNIYTRCDRLWNCPNGVDEIGCDLRVQFNCSLNHHICVSPHTNEFMCLSIDQANDGRVDCLGATDEPLLCRTENVFERDFNSFHCTNQVSESCISFTKLCDGNVICEQGDDEQFCKTNLTVPSVGAFCSIAARYGSDVEKFLCNQAKLPRKAKQKNFLLGQLDRVVNHAANNIEIEVFPSSSLTHMSDQFHSRCHRGLDLTVWLNSEQNLTNNTCLCPPSFYGDRCQYQNQRISLSVKFRALSNSRETVFAIVVSLIDTSNQRIIHSYEQISFFPTELCDDKFDMYLLYSTRPKDKTKDYAIHIDIYEKHNDSLSYRGSALYPVTFPFLPVHRLAFLVDIPRIGHGILSCSNMQCIHGECIRYSNSPQTFTFCRCKEGWSGKYCTIPHNCTCASGSLCIGISANNQSICVCPLNRFGPRCFLIDTTCQNDNNSICENGGQCIFNSGYRISEGKFTCICLEGFSGPQCEFIDYKLALSFNKEIVLSQSILIHFINIISTPPRPVQRWTTFQTIRVRQNSVIVYSSNPFHLVFIELSDQTFYLALMRQIQFGTQAIANSTVNPSNRCPSINELFNQTFVQWPLIRRIKYYHLPCQKQSLNLSCFYDDVHLCLCQSFGQKRLANCFKFEHNMKFDCDGTSECENGAQCFQDNPTCPQKSLCKCRPCYFGRRCQFSTRGFGLSLDAILGYHILPNIAVTDQSAIVQFSFTFTMIFMIVGLIDGTLCIITFKNKSVREVGCGLYLLASSIATICIMMMFTLKFLILLLVQMTWISNRSFLQIQCVSFDFILRVCLNMDQWLSACVAMERAITAIKATRFNKKQSKRAAKYVIVILLITIIVSTIHDPIHRRLVDEIDDTKEKRTWCVVIYPLGLGMFDSIINTLHFFGPFILNVISPIILITTKSRQQLTVHNNRIYKEVLLEEFLQHKHLLVGPIVLVILGLPRLIIIYVSKCMKSPSDAWLYLIGYLISFIPCMVTLIIFILPSKFYKKVLNKSISQYRTIIQQRLHRTS